MDQKALLASAAAAEEQGLKRGSEVTTEQLATLTSRGMKVTEASSDLLASLKTIGATMTDEWRKKATPEQREVLQAYEANLKK